MKYRHILWLATVLLCTIVDSTAQSTGSYWQQTVHYDIDVRLNDKLHELNGNIKIDYTNNSPDTLYKIYMHLWPNAYKNDQTAYAKQARQIGETGFYFTSEKDRGYIDQLNFTVNEEPVNWSYDILHIDIAELILNEPLLPGQTIGIVTPFKVKVPESTSRLGHADQAYQISQWHPKPAVYDSDGWHPMPYLELGEYYAEFGSFDVRISLPENYVVAATGQLITESEQDFIDSLAGLSAMDVGRSLQGQVFPVSSTTYKTIRFTADNVHDFAWFADKRFEVEKRLVLLPSGHRVDCYAYYPGSMRFQWKGAVKYVSQAVFMFSNEIGEYPYNQCSAVYGGSTVGGAMEYPMITLVGYMQNAIQLEAVIAHEVAHNWFQGMLATNERAYPWMDESLTSYYEVQYTEEYIDEESNYGQRDASSYPFFVADYLYQARQGEAQAINLSSTELSADNYYFSIYAKGALAFNYLESYLGKQTFRQAIQAYYSQWAFKHPQPEDLRSVFEDVSGENLDWFFSDLLSHEHGEDYVLSSIKPTEEGSQLTIKTKQGPAMPLHISSYGKDGELVEQNWLMAPEEKAEATIELDDAHHYRLNANWLWPDINPGNNYIKSKGLFKKHRPFSVALYSKLEDPAKAQLFLAPYLAWNNADKTQIGLGIHNGIFPPKRFHYLLAPAYGTASKDVIGIARATKYWYPKGLKEISFGASVWRYNYQNSFNAEKNGNDQLRFHKFSPQLKLVFNNKSVHSNLEKSLSLRSVMVLQEINVFTNGANQVQTHFYNTNEASFKLENTNRLYPYSVEFAVEQCKTYLALKAEAELEISYFDNVGGFNLRLFAGLNLLEGGVLIDDDKGLVPPRREFTLSTNALAGNLQAEVNEDYMYDRIYFDRSGQDRFFRHQVFLAEGGFRSLTSIGLADEWLVSINASSTIPNAPFVKPYLNVAAGNFVAIKKENGGFAATNPSVAAEGGVSIVSLNGIFEIHFPVFTTFNIKYNQEEILGLDDYWDKITFTLDLMKLDIFKPDVLVN